MRFIPRLAFLFLCLLCTGMLAVGYWMQYALGLEPCPLCITQRIFIFLTGFTGLVAALHGSAATGARVYAGLTLIFSLCGAGFSSRHLWLQILPANQVPACGPSLEYMFDTFPLGEALVILLRGTGDCAKVDWSFLGVSIPGWTLLGFCIMAATAIRVLYRPGAKSW